METMAHEWIENFTEYEAVLRCLNPLSPWDQDATVRAFQTFEWNHASNPGGDLEFAHKDTPVVVRFDGAVVAILFGEGKLNEAMPDLFAVLSSLGWHSAEVYHPSESLSGLMSDFGKAIPASMDFDVKPARRGQEISDFAGMPLFVTHVHNAMNSEGKTANDIILSELLSMDARDDDSPTTSAPSSSHAFSSMVLEDDDAEPVSSEDVVVASAERTSIPSPTWSEGRQEVRATKSPLVDVDDESPRVFPPLEVIEAHSHSGRDDTDHGAGHSTNDMTDDLAQTQADLVIENERLRDALRAAQDLSLTVEEEVVALTQAQELATVVAQELSEKHESVQAELAAAVLLNATLQNAVLAAEKKAADCDQTNAGLLLENESLQFGLDQVFAAANRHVKVGLSGFCFDVPNAPLTDDDTNKMAEVYGTQEVIHLYLGAAASSVRWDVLSEVELAYPWSAEKMAHAMGFHGKESGLISKRLLDLKQSKQAPQLRDLLVDEGQEAIESVKQKLGRLSLCPVGQAFVDLPVEAGDTGVEVFTVRGVLQSSSARLFVVHVDELDGPFVAWMSELLGSVVQAYAVSKRGNQVMRVNTAQTLKNKEIALAQEKIVDEVNGVVDDLIAKLEKVRNMASA